MRALLFAGVAAAVIGADTQAREAAPSSLFRSDRFVIAGNACEASAYAHLVGRESDALEDISLPPLSRVVRGGVSNTLEYKPNRLNLILGGDDRVVAVGCF